MGSNVELDRDGAVAWISFNRPEVLNAIDRPTAEDFLAVARRVAEADDVRAVVVAGAGRAFIAGGDLHAFVEPGRVPADTLSAIITPFHQAILTLVRMDAPVLASLHGAVAGGGLGLALSCDLAIAADDTRLAMASPRVGTSPDGGSTWALPRLVGLRRAMEIALLDEPIDAERALQLGLVNKVVPAARLEEETAALAQRLARGPTMAFGRTKALLRQSFDATLPHQLEAERDSFMACTRTEDFITGVNNFLGRAKEPFRGC